MAKAAKRVTTQRRAASKKQKAPSKQMLRVEDLNPEVRAQWCIEQCVIYLQSVAAYSAGCEADGYDYDIAGAGAPLGKAQLEAANRALSNLVELSAICTGKTPPSIPEIRAKAAVCEGMMKFDGPNVLETVHIEFLEGFAREVSAYFKMAALKMVETSSKLRSSDNER
jgi:hypothetical protein